MKQLAALKPFIRSLQSRIRKARQAAGPVVAQLRGMFRNRRFATIAYLAVAFALITTAALSLRLVQVRDGANPPKYLLTLRGDPKFVLSQCGETVGRDDAVEFSGFKNNYGSIKILRAFEVSVTADSQTRIVQIAKGTVGDALRKSGIIVGSNDLVNLSLDSPVSQGTNICVQRVSFKTVIKFLPVACTYEKQETPLLKKGNLMVETPGENGQNSITMLQKFVDGVKTDENVIAQAVIRKPKPGTLLVGTARETPISRLEPGGMVLTSRGEPTRYSKCLVGRATSYTSRGNHGTASGRKLETGVVAVNPDLIPYGTRLYITTTDGSYVYGNAVAADTGGFVHNGSGVLVDLYFSSTAQANQFGSQNVKVYILD